MNASVNLEIPPHAHPFDDEDLDLYPHGANGGYVFQTSEYSTQVNMDAEFPREDLSKIKKRNKKKEYKRKKKQKLREEQRCAKIHLADIIDLIYKQQTTFEECELEIQECLELLLGGDKFHSFLNQAIRIHVNNVQKEIWDFMQEIIHENPFEKPNEDQDFYLVMVDKIYLEYQKLRQSSLEIERIINLFMCLSQIPEDRSQCQNLDRSTFNYLIESDQTIKSLIRICQKRISGRHERQIKQLREIGQMMQFDDSENEEYEEYITEKSTSVDEEENEEKNTKKKKKKLKESEFVNNIDDIMRRLNEMIIVDESRTQCKADQNWLERISNKYGAQGG